MCPIFLVLNITFSIFKWPLNFWTFELGTCKKFSSSRFKIVTQMFEVVHMTLKNPDFYQFFYGMATWFVIIPGQLINHCLGDKGQNEQTCKDFLIPATFSDQANGGVFVTLVGALDDLVRCREKPSYVQLKAGRVQLFPIRWKDSTDISVRTSY